MNSNAIAGISVIVFTYTLMSWALGKYLNKKKEPKTTELKNFLSGAWVIGIFIALGFIISYFS